MSYDQGTDSSTASSPQGVPPHTPQKPDISPAQPSSSGDLNRQAVMMTMLEELTRELDQEVILQQALRAIMQLERWQSVGISLLAPDGEHWQTRAEDRSLPGEVGLLHPLTKGVIGRAYRTGELQLVPNVAEDPDFILGIDVNMISSELVVPIRFDQQVFGAINIESDQVNAFDQDDVDFAQAIARILAIALKNAERVEALRAENTERRRVEQALRGVLLNLEGAEAQAGLGSWSFDVRSGEGWWSNQMFVLLRRDPAAGIPDAPAYLELIHPDDRDLIATTMAQMAQGRPPEQREFRTCPSRGPMRTLSPSYRVEYGPDGTITAFFGTVLDITERQYAEEEMRWARDLFTRLFHSSPIPTLFTSMPDGTIIDVNEASQVVFGYNRHDLIGSSAVDAMVLADPSVRVLLRETLIREGRVNGMECRVRDSADNLRVCMLYIEPLKIHDRIYTLTQVVDLTERKRSEEALRESEQQYRYLFEHNPHPMWAYDLRTLRFLAVNDAAITKYGYTRAEFLAMTIADIRPPEDVPHLLEDLARPRESIEHSTGWRHRTRAGDVIDVEITSHRIELEGNEAALVVAQDITARKRAEEALRASEEQLLELNRTLEERVRERTAEVQDLYDHAPAGYHSLDEEGRIVRINQTQLNALGYQREDVVGHFFTEFMSAACRPMFLNYFPLLKERGWIRDIELELVRKNGSTFSVLVNATALYDESGRYVMSRSTLLDITDRKQVEDALRTSQMRLQDFLDTASDLILSIEANGRISYVNSASCATLGYSPEEAQALTLYDIVDAVFEEQCRTLMQELQASGQARQVELLLRKKGGAAVVVEGSVSIWKDPTGRVTINGLFRDMTQRRQAEEALRLANAELERALHTKDEFMANMSHELRTPLNAILALSEILREGLRGPLNERQHDALRHIETSGQHLLTLINDVLDLSKVEAGRLELAIERVSLAEVSRASMQFVKELALKKHIHLGLSLGDEPAYCEADPRRLKQMLVNLLSNAVKFTPEGGAVSLEVNVLSADGVVQLSVADTGIGIAPEQLSRLFQPFTQLDARLSRHHEGTGLGLVLVRRLAELHGGTIDVTSEQGRGSRFTISLPYRTEAHPLSRDPHDPAQAQPLSLSVEGRPASEASRSTGAKGGLRVLLAEDNEINLEVVRDFLEAKGYAVSAARDGLQALAIAAQEPPDIVLMDIQMPEMDGLEAIRRLRGTAACARTPIIALTALAMPGDRERCLSAGADAYMTKPVRLSELATLIATLTAPSAAP